MGVKKWILLSISVVYLYGCSKEGNVEEPVNEALQPKLLSFSFLAKDNPEKIVKDCIGTIEGDSLIRCHVPHVISDRELIPYCDYQGDCITIGGNGGGQNRLFITSRDNSI